MSPRLPLGVAIAVFTLASSAGAALAQDDFENAVRASQTRQATAGPLTSSPQAPARDRGLAGLRDGGGRGRGVVGAIAAPGAMPLRFRAMTNLNDANWFALRSAIRDGELDGVAMMEHLVGPLPVPSGARPMRCLPNHDVLYTLGAEASPEYLAALQAYTSGGGDLRSRFPMERRRLAASPQTLAVKQRTEDFLLAAGLVRSTGDIADRWTYRTGPSWRGRMPITVTLDDDTFRLHDVCRQRGIEIPTGPTMTISYDYRRNTKRF